MVFFFLVDISSFVCGKHRKANDKQIVMQRKHCNGNVLTVYL